MTLVREGVCFADIEVDFEERVRHHLEAQLAAHLRHHRAGADLECGWIAVTNMCCSRPHEAKGQVTDPIRSPQNMSAIGCAKVALAELLARQVASAIFDICSEDRTAAEHRCAAELPHSLLSSGIHNDRTIEVASGVQGLHPYRESSITNDPVGCVKGAFIENQHRGVSLDGEVGKRMLAIPGVKFGTTGSFWPILIWYKNQNRNYVGCHDQVTCVAHGVAGWLI